MLDSAIIKINDYVHLLNTERGHRTPDTASVIHKRHGHGSSYEHNYGKLTDGIHPDESVVKYWAKRLNEIFSQFM